MTEFWPELLTEASWKKLQELKKELKGFVVIGGWAVYLWTGLHKSKDIDIVVDFKNLERLRQAYNVGKNMQLRKYEIKLERFDIDVYVPHFSRFVIPLEDIVKEHTAGVQGFDTPKPEALVILKQSAEIERRGSVKGEKDAIDIISMASRSPFEIKRYVRMLKRYGLLHYAGEFRRVVEGFDAKSAGQVAMGFVEFQKWRKRFAKELADCVR